MSTASAVRGMVLADERMALAQLLARDPEARHEKAVTRVPLDRQRARLLHHGLPPYRMRFEVQATWRRTGDGWTLVQRTLVAVGGGRTPAVGVAPLPDLS